jgi:hypothetical protein
MSSTVPSNTGERPESRQPSAITRQGDPAVGVVELELRRVGDALCREVDAQVDQDRMKSLARVDPIDDDLVERLFRHSS